MAYTYGNYKYEKKELPYTGGSKQWLYSITNTETVNKFSYKIAISDTLLESENNLEELQKIADSQGDHLVKTWLDKKLEEKRQAIVRADVGIREKRISKDAEWLKWDDLSWDELLK